MARDLRAERIKATNALKERAKLKVENESLQQQLFAAKDSVSVTKNSMDSLREEFSNIKLELEKSINEGKHAKTANERLRDTINNMEKEKDELHHSSEVAAELSRDRQSQIFMLEEENLLLKGKLEASEEMVRKLEVETTEAVMAKSALEEANAMHLEKIREKMALLEGMRDRIVKAESLELANKQLASANEALKSELNNALDSGAKLTDSARKYAREDVERTLARDVLNGEVSRLKQELEDALSSLHTIEDANTALQGRIAAEVENHEHSKKRVSDYERRVNTLTEELNLTKNMLDDVTKRYNETESAFGRIKLDLSAAEATRVRVEEIERENTLLTTHVKDLSAKLNEASDAKKELFEMKKKLVKADMEGIDQSCTLDQPKGLDGSGVDELKGTSVNGEKTSIHNEITIRELSEKLAHSDAKLQDSLSALSDAKKKIHQLSQLEDEVDIIKATARELAIEKQQQIDAATEANTVSMKLLASKEDAVKEAMSLEQDLDNVKKECEYLKTTLKNEKDKNKQLYTEKLGVERRVAELTALQSRSSSSIEEQKNKCLENEYELERARRTARDLESEIQSLKLSLWQEQQKSRRDVINSEGDIHANPTQHSFAVTAESEMVRPGTDMKFATPTKDSITKSTSASLPTDIVELQEELERARYSHALAEREVSSLKASLKVQRQGFDNALAECRRLHEVNRKLQDQVNRDRSDVGSTSIVTSNTSNLSSQDKDLCDLRSELTATVKEMNAASAITRHKTDLVLQLQDELKQEKEFMQEIKDKMSRLEAKEATLTGGESTPAKPQNGVSDPLDALLESAESNDILPLSPMAMMDYSTKSLEQTKKQNQPTIYHCSRR